MINNSMRGLIGCGYHLGSSVMQRHPSMMPYLAGTRRGLDYFDLRLSLAMLKRALRVLNEMVTQNGQDKQEAARILFVGHGPLVPTLLKARVPTPHGYLNNRWIAGILDNWDEKVVGPLRHYLSEPEFLLQKTHHNRFKKTLVGLAPLERKPDLVVFMSRKGQEVGLKECWQANVPTIALVGSDCDSRYVTYPIPANCDRLAVQWLVLSLLLEALDIK